MIDRKFQRPLHLFSWVACGAMTVKLVLFTEWNKRHPGQPHVFTGVRKNAGSTCKKKSLVAGGIWTETCCVSCWQVQEYADKKLDEFFGVETLVDKAASSSPPQDSKPSEGSV